jgi:decaprenylphospho-beta-D-ribofuranose 2-oxidase
MRPELVETMYPRLGEWRAAQQRLDPEGVMRSDLSRRLGLLR